MTVAATDRRATTAAPTPAAPTPGPLSSDGAGAAPSRPPRAAGPSPRPLVRPAGAEDADPTRAFLAGLSLESSYRRFFTGVGRPSDRLVRRLVDVDHDRREALVAVAGAEIVGLADYALIAGRADVAEFGVVVADGWQRRGLGPRLVGELLAVAGDRGVVAMRAHTLADNARVARLLRRRWPAVRPVREDTLLVWELPL